MKILNVHQVARMLRVSECLVYRSLRSGRLPGGKVGHCWRISERALEEYLTGRRDGSQRSGS